MNRAPGLGRHRLYWKIWLAILATVVLFALLATAAWRLIGERPHPPNVTGFAELASEVLPPPEATRAEQQAALDRWQRRLGADLALYGRDGALLAATRDDLVALPRREGEPEHHVMTPRGPALALALPDGRELLMLRPSRPPPPGPVLTFALIALGVGVGAFPVVRRLTRRLERLQAGVTEWGAGNLATRVVVEGHDEVAQLASTFNEAAARIEKLVGAHKSLLANASHELRSPLARIRLGVELLSTDPSAARRDELARDIAELDQLIDEILLASRLEGGAAPEFEAGRPHRARGRRMCARRGRSGSRAGAGSRQRAPAAATGAQPDRKCAALRWGPGRSRPSRRAGRDVNSTCSTAGRELTRANASASSSRSIAPAAPANRAAE